jgi:hypothetical protein
MLAAVALAGYLAGHGNSRAAASGGGGTVIAPAGSVLLHYPASWRAAKGAPQIPGLALSRELVLGPDGHAGQAGLLVGQLPAAESAPVPEGFMALARQMKAPEVVILPEAQGYRYQGLKVSGFKPELTLYVIPSPGGPSTALACYAPSASGDDMATCEQVVSTLTLIGESQNYALTPAPSYARELTAWIATLDRERLAVRRGMSVRATPATTQRLAGRLVSILAKAASDLSALEAPPAAGPAQTRLAASLWRARDAYTTLASSAPSQDAVRLTAARAQIDSAEAGVSRSLERFAWLGYAHR